MGQVQPGGLAQRRFVPVVAVLRPARPPRASSPAASAIAPPTTVDLPDRFLPTRTRNGRVSAPGRRGHSRRRRDRETPLVPLVVADLSCSTDTRFTNMVTIVPAGGAGGKAAVPGKAGMAASARAALPECGNVAGRLLWLSAAVGVLCSGPRIRNPVFSARWIWCAAPCRPSASDGVRTYQRGGNVVVHSMLGRDEVTDLVRRVRAETVRNGTCRSSPLGCEIDDVITANPFTIEAPLRPHLVRVMFLTAFRRTRSLTRSGPSSGRLLVPRRRRPHLHRLRRGRGRTRCTPQRPARALGVDGIERNWRTVLALASCARPPPRPTGRRPTPF